MTDAVPKQPVDLDAVSEHWRLAIHSAQQTLQAAWGCGKSLPFAAAELRQRDSHLGRERSETAALLDAVAREEGVELHHLLTAPWTTSRMLGLPDDVLACVYDLDGVLTSSAAIHAAAWAETFNELLSRRLERTGERFAPFMPFDPNTDYYRHVHGKPRVEGVHAFLASRGIRLPEGDPGDPAGAETVHGLASRKNEVLHRRLERDGVTAFAGSRVYLEDAREAELRSAVVSASSNSAAILERAGLAGLIDQLVDGNTIRAEKLRGKPEPDTLLAACRQLGVAPGHAAAFETTLTGLTAARAAGFALVVGVDRAGAAEDLRGSCADVVVSDLSALLDPVLAG